MRLGFHLLSWFAMALVAATGAFAWSTRRASLTLSHGTVVWGHSQGGRAALWTGALAPGYAPELDVVGVAALVPLAQAAALGHSIFVHDPNAGSLGAMNGTAGRRRKLSGA